jgi:hypothetical protein
MFTLRFVRVMVTTDELPEAIGIYEALTELLFN